jgi:hypothetical protein
MLDNVMALLPTKAFSSEMDTVRMKETRQIKKARAFSIQADRIRLSSQGRASS